MAQWEKYRVALQGQFPQGSDVPLKVRNRKSSSVVDIQNIPMEEMGTPLEALFDHVPPGNGPRRAK